MAKQRGRKPNSFYQPKVETQEPKIEEVSNMAINESVIPCQIEDNKELEKELDFPASEIIIEDKLNNNESPFETMPNCEMFMPTLTGECKGEYVFKVRRVQAEIDFDSNNSFSWQNSQTIADTVRARVVTGVRYNEVFKNDYIVKPAYDFMIKDKFDIKPRVIDINGELGFEIKATRKLVLKIEDEIATISFINK